MQEEHQEQFCPVQLQPQHAGDLTVFNALCHEKDILVLKTLKHHNKRSRPILYYSSESWRQEEADGSQKMSRSVFNIQLYFFADEI